MSNFCRSGIMSIHKIKFKKNEISPCVSIWKRYRVHTIYCFHTMSYEIWALLSEDSQKNCISKQRWTAGTQKCTTSPCMNL